MLWSSLYLEALAKVSAKQVEGTLSPRSNIVVNSVCITLVIFSKWCALMLLCIQHLVSKVYGFLDLMRSVLSEDYAKSFYSLSISDDNDNDEEVLIFLWLDPVTFMTFGRKYGGTVLNLYFYLESNHSFITQFSPLGWPQLLVSVITLSQKSSSLRSSTLWAGKLQPCSCLAVGAWQKILANITSFVCCQNFRHNVFFHDDFKSLYRMWIVEAQTSVQPTP